MYPDQWPDNVFPVDPLKGRVRQVTEKAFSIKAGTGRSIKELEYTLILSYDEEGYLISEAYFNSDGSPANTIEYEYTDGNLSLKLQKHPEVRNPDREMFTYSPDGRILEAEKIYSTGNYGWRYKNSYNSNGKIVLTSKYDRYWKWMLVYSRMFEYDNMNRLAATEGFGMDSELLWRDERKYDDLSRVVEEIKYDPDGELVVSVATEYNSRDLAVKKEFTDNRGIVYAVYAYGYTYDEKDNWLVKIIGREEPGTYSNYLIPESTVERKIEYYD